MDNKAQISAELIIIMAIIAAFAVFLFQNLQGTVGKVSKTLDEKTSKLVSEIEKLK
jgi:Tfp pilus assembly protein FimT